MREIELIRTSAKRVTVVVREEGATVAKLACSPDSPSSRAAVCRLLKCDDRTLLGWLDACDASRTGTHIVKPDGVTVADGEYTVREFEVPTGVTTRLTPARACTDLLPTVPLDRLLCWSSLADLSCLDVDYHGTKPPRRALLETWVRDRLTPQPFAWHFSRGGGVHAFYVQTPPFTAESLAAMAAVRWRTIDPTAGVEIKRQVRGPGTERVHYSPGGAQDTTGTLSAWIGADTPDSEAIEEWLSVHDLEIGGRYGHEKCPMDPGAATSATGDPVTVSEHGVYCHRCAGHGVSVGSRKPGFASWASLCGSPSAGDVGRMVRNLAHWGHAGVVLSSKFDLPDAIARPAYECALQAYHEGDPRIGLVFHPDTAKLTRSGDQWMNLDSGYVYPTNTVGPLLQILPQAVTLGDDGKTRSVASTVAYLNQGHDLADRGYPNVRVVHGYPLARQFLPPTPNQPPTVSVIAPELRALGGRAMPRYVKASQRRSVQWAEGVLAAIFPGICWRTIRVLMCASGVAQETKLGMHPLLFINGGAATAKTSHCKIAAAVLGARTTAITYTSDEARLKQAVKEAGKTSCLVQADEFLKEAKRQMRRTDPRAALEALLTITADTACHEMYVGPRKLGNVPALILTEPMCPPAIKDYLQVARRLRVVKLTGRKDSWKGLMAANGLSGDNMVRLRAVSPDVAEACDVILSDVIDTYFSVPMTWDQMADSLNVRTIEDSDEFEDTGPLLLRFFELICSAPPPVDKPRTRFPAAAGWKRINKTEATGDDAEELRDLYESFAAGTQGADWARSEILSEKDWGTILRTDEPVHLDLRGDGGTAVYVRFFQGLPKNPKRLNGAICDPSKLADRGREAGGGAVPPASPGLAPAP